MLLPENKLKAVSGSVGISLYHKCIPTGSNELKVIFHFVDCFFPYVLNFIHVFTRLTDFQYIILIHL